MQLELQHQRAYPMSPRASRRVERKQTRFYAGRCLCPYPLPLFADPTCCPHPLILAADRERPVLARLARGCAKKVLMQSKRVVTNKYTCNCNYRNNM